MQVKKLCLSLGFVALCNVNTYASQPSEISQVRQQQLTHLVKQDCGSCHGMTLKGGLGTPLLPDDLKNKTVELLTHTIMHGRPTTAMPPWQEILNQHEARWIAQQLKRGHFTHEK